MTITKKQVEDECDKNIAEIQRQIDALEIEHKKFSAEDERQDDLDEMRQQIEEKMAKLEAQAYIGNWGTRDNWYHGTIPAHFKIKDYGNDKSLFKDALTNLKNKKMKEIESSDEYRNLNAQHALASCSALSSEHHDIHSKILRFKHSIEHNICKRKKVQSRGGLMQYAKDVAYREKINAEAEIRAKKIAEFEEYIQKMKVDEQ